MAAPLAGRALSRSYGPTSPGLPGEVTRVGNSSPPRKQGTLTQDVPFAAPRVGRARHIARARLVHGPSPATCTGENLSLTSTLGCRVPAHSSLVQSALAREYEAVAPRQA